MQVSDITVERIAAAYKKWDISPNRTWCVGYTDRGTFIRSTCGCPMAVLCIDALGGHESWSDRQERYDNATTRLVAEILGLPPEFVSGFIDGYDEPRPGHYILGNIAGDRLAGYTLGGKVARELSELLA